MATTDADLIARFAELSRRPYKAQAIHFLNGFWGDGIDAHEANKVWDRVAKFAELGEQQRTGGGHSGGNELDQFWSARYLEVMDAAMPALQRKQALKAIDTDSNGCMSCLEYLTWKYGKGVRAVVDAPQGSADPRELERAQKMMDQLKEALAQQRKEEAALAVAEREQNAAVAELKAQEDAYSGRIAELEQKSREGTTVQKSKAANELAQLRSEDPLPLRKAKITQEAVLRKVKRAQKALEAAIAGTIAGIAAAEEELTRIRNSGGVAKGDMWWMQRELFETDSFMPRAKQRFDHGKAFFFEPAAQQ